MKLVDVESLALNVATLLHKKIKQRQFFFFVYTPSQSSTTDCLGVENEQNARNSYVKHMISLGHTGLVPSDAGFVVHSEKRWWGATPDAWIIDPSVDYIIGIAEFKCPYT